MRLRLRTKLTIFIALLVLGVVGGVSWLYLARLTRQVIQQADDRAGLVTKQGYTLSSTRMPRLECGAHVRGAGAVTRSGEAGQRTIGAVGLDESKGA